MRSALRAIIVLTVVNVALSFACATKAAAQTDLGPGTLTGSAEVGAFAQPVPYTDVAKSREYHDMAQQIIVPELKALFGDKEGRYFADFYALNLGQTNEIYNLRTGIYGLLDVQAQWLEIPHFYSDNVAASPYTRQGAHFLLTSRPTASGESTGANVQAWLSDAARPLPLSLLEGIANLHVRYTPSPFWTLSAYYNFQNPTGNRVLGSMFGPDDGNNNITELFEPIDYDTYNYGVGIQYANGTWSLGFKYDGSFFHNPYDTLTWQNPDTWGEMTGPAGACVDSAAWSASTGTGACNGRETTYPDNQAHTFTLNGGLNLPLHTHLMVSASYGWWLQNSDFTSFTDNSAIPFQPLPRARLGGDVQPFFVNATVVSNPIQRLDLKASYRYYNYDNQSPYIHFNNVLALNDTLLVATSGGPWTAAAYPFSFSDQGINLGASYRITPTLAARFTGNLETYHNSGLMVLQQDQTSYGPVLDWNPYDWLLFRGSYQHGFRDSPGYDGQRATLVSQMATHGEPPGLRDFNEATVEINRFSLYSQVAPFQAEKEVTPFQAKEKESWLAPLTLYAAMDYEDLNYPASDLGLQHSSNYSPSVGLNYELGSNLSLSADYGWQATDWDLRGLDGFSAFPPSATSFPPASPNPAWTGHGREQGSSFDFNANATIPRNRILHNASRLSVRYTYAVTTDLLHASGDEAFGPAVDYPNVGSQFHELIAQYEYPFGLHAALKIGYYLSHFGENDFGYDQLRPWMSASPYSAFLGDSTWTPYNTNAGYITFRYKF